MHAIQERPIAENGQVVIRPMMYLALTYDHRLIDGRDAVQFWLPLRRRWNRPNLAHPRLSRRCHLLERRCSSSVVWKLPIFMTISKIWVMAW